nr:hypothetical protein [Klebsiella pneumoniae]
MLTLTDIRASNTVLVTEFGGVRAVHFCLHEKLSGNDNDLWFPLANGTDLFEALESIMCINFAAANVVSLEFLRQNGKMQRLPDHLQQGQIQAIKLDIWHH